MSLRGLVCAFIGALAAAACVSIDPLDAPGESTAPEQEVLVMLRMPPPHFRPDMAYAGSYESSLGASARGRIADELAHRHHLMLVTRWPMPVLGVDCFVMRAPASDDVAEVARRLALDPRVEWAQPMHSFETIGYNDPLYALQPGAAQWDLADLHRLATGRGVRIAEIDTGVELDHPDLVGQVELSRNFVDASPYAAEVHGTAVAGIIAARANDGVGIAGVAPGARLLALRACWQLPEPARAANCSSFTLAKALQYAIEQRVRVINLSLGGPRDRLLERLLDAAFARGIAVIGAVNPKMRDGGFPASYPGVIAVTSAGTPGSPSAAVLAPGRDVITSTPVRAWSFVSGPSYAAAHVTGLVGLLIEISPERAPSQLRDALATGPPGAKAVGEVDACAAVARAAGTCACSCALAHDRAPPAHR